MLKNLFDITYDHYFQKIVSFLLRFSTDSQIKMHSICNHLIVTHINIIKMHVSKCRIRDVPLRQPLSIWSLLTPATTPPVFQIKMSTSELRKSVTNSTLSYSIIFIPVTHLFMFVQYVSLSGNKSFSNDVYTSNFLPFSILTRTYLKKS